jgi:hypothetical protein
MLTVQEVKPKLENLKNWLIARGAEVFDPIGDFELFRFKTQKGWSSFYFKKTGVITFFGEAETVWNAFTKNTNWRACPRVKRPKAHNRHFDAIRKRDGDLCFYCRLEVENIDASEEHLVALAHGGPNHISNKLLAHKKCNNAVGHLSAAEKIKIHVAAITAIRNKK